MNYFKPILSPHLKILGNIFKSFEYYLYRSTLDTVLTWWLVPKIKHVCILSSMLSSGYSLYWTWSVRLFVANVGPDSGRTVVCVSACTKAGTSTWYASLTHIVAQWSRRRLSRRSLSCLVATRAHTHTHFAFNARTTPTIFLKHSFSLCSENSRFRAIRFRERLSRAMKSSSFFPKTE